MSQSDILNLEIEETLERLKGTMLSSIVVPDEVVFDDNTIPVVATTTSSSLNKNYDKQTLSEKRKEIIALATEIQTIINKQAVVYKCDRWLMETTKHRMESPEIKIIDDARYDIMQMEPIPRDNTEDDAQQNSDDTLTTDDVVGRNNDDAQTTDDGVFSSVSQADLTDSDSEDGINIVIGNGLCWNLKGNN